MIMDFKKLKVFPQLGSRDVICINLSSNNLKLAYARVSSARKEFIDLISCKIQGLSNEDIAELIRTAVVNLKLSMPETIISIPSHLAIVKNIEIPSLDEQEIKEIIDLQAGRHTPYSREEIIIDYINIGTYKENYTKVLLVIVTLSVIRRQIEILERANLKTEKVYFAPEGMSRVCLKMLKLKQEDTVRTLIHIDLNFTDFINIAKGQLIFIRSIPIGIRQLTTEKERFQTRFVEEIRKSLEAYQNEDIGKIPDELFITGVIEETRELQDLLNNMLHIPVRSFSYLKEMPIQSEELIKSVTEDKESYFDIVAPILASESMHTNLIPEEIKLRKIFEDKSRDLVRAGIYVMITLALILSLLINNVYFKSAYLKNLTRKYQPTVEAAGRLDDDFSKMQLIKYELKDRYIPLEILSELYDLIPMDIQLNGIKYDLQGKFSIGGNARTMATVFTFISDLEESKYFESVESKRTTKRKEGDEEIVDFEIISLLEE